MALEPRVLLDAAVVDAATEAAGDAGADGSAPASRPPDTDAPADALAEALESHVPPAAHQDQVDTGRARATDIVFIDSTVADTEVIARAVKRGAEIITVPQGQDSLSFMAEALKGRSGVEAVHLVSHGVEGKLILGGQALTLEGLEARANDLAAIGSVLTADGDVLLYGCDVGAGSDGAAYLGRLAALTGADVAASDDTTGAASLGGDWSLEVVSGAVERASAFDGAISAYDGVLASAPTSVNLDGDVLNYSTGYGTLTLDQGTAVVISDADSTDFNGGSLTISLQGGNADETLSISTGGTVSLSNGMNLNSVVSISGVGAIGQITATGAAGGDLVITFTSANATPTTVSTLANAIQYSNTSTAMGPFTRATFTLDDGDGSGGVSIGVVEVDLNDAPGIYYLNGDSLTYTEGSGAVTLDQGDNAVIGDRNSGSFAGGTMTVSVGGATGNEDLTIDTSGTVSLSAGMINGSVVSVSGATVGTITGTGQGGANLVIEWNGATPSSTNISTITRAIQYTHSGAGLSGSRMVSFVTTDGDGGTSDAAEVTVTLSGPSNAPVISNLNGDIVTYVEGGDAVLIDGGTALSITDPDSGDFDGGVLTISVVGATTYDYLYVENGTGVSAAGTDPKSVQVSGSGYIGRYRTGYGNTGTSLVIDLYSTANATNVARLLSAVRYANMADDPTGTRTIAITLSDGDGDTSATSTVTVNQASVTGDVIDFDEFDNDGLPAIWIETDVGGGIAELYLRGYTFSLDAVGSNTTGHWSIYTSPLDPTYNSTLTNQFIGYGGAATFTLTRTADPTAEFDFQSFVLKQESNSADRGVDYIEGYRDGVLVALYDPTTEIGASFDTSTGRRTLTMGSGFDNVDRVVFYSQSNGFSSLYDTFVLDAASSPIVSNVDGDSVSYTEGDAAVALDVGGNASVTDPDSSHFNGGALTVSVASAIAGEDLTIDTTGTVSLSAGMTNGSIVRVSGVTIGSITGTGQDGASLGISFSSTDATSAAVGTLIQALRYSGSGYTASGTRSVSVALTDTDGNPANTSTVSVAVTATPPPTEPDGNEAPVMGGIGDAVSQVSANAGPVVVSDLADATVSDGDSSNFNGGSLTISQGSGTANGSWGLSGATVTSGGDGVFAAGESIVVGGVTIGTVHATNTGQGGGSLVITFTSDDATSARVQTLIRALTYDAPSGPGTRTFTATLDDGDGGSSSTSNGFSVSVVPRAPVVSNLDGDRVQVSNGGVVAIDIGGNATVSDADSTSFDGGTLTIARTGGLSGDFCLSGSGSTGVSAGASLATADGTIAAGDHVYVDGVRLGSVASVSDGQGGNNLVLTLEAVTPAQVQAFIRGLMYTSTAGGSHTFDLTIRDAATDAATSTAVSFIVDVDAADADGPVNTVPGDGLQAVDGQPLSLSDLSVTSTNGGTVTTTISVADGAGLFTVGGGAVISGNGTRNVTLSGSVAEVNASLATLIYTPAENSSGSQTITVVTSDGSGSDTDTIAVTVLDRPSWVNLHGDATTTVVGAAEALEQGGDAAVVDGDSATFDGGVLTLTRVDGSLAGAFSVDGTAILSGGDGVLAVGETIRVGDTDIGTVTEDGSGTGNLVIVLNANATPALVGQLIRGLRYTGASAGAHAFDVTVTDSATGVASDAARTTVTVTAAPDSPSPTDPTTPPTQDPSRPGPLPAPPRGTPTTSRPSPTDDGGRGSVSSQMPRSLGITGLGDIFRAEGPGQSPLSRAFWTAAGQASMSGYGSFGFGFRLALGDLRLLGALTRVDAMTGDLMILQNGAWVQLETLDALRLDGSDAPGPSASLGGPDHGRAYAWEEEPESGDDDADQDEPAARPPIRGDRAVAQAFPAPRDFVAALAQEADLSGRHAEVERLAMALASHVPPEGPKRWL